MGLFPLYILTLFIRNDKHIANQRNFYRLAEDFS